MEAELPPPMTLNPSETAALFSVFKQLTRGSDTCDGLAVPP